jgi:DnaJ-class molecular chaperone
VAEESTQPSEQAQAQASADDGAPGVDSGGCRACRGSGSVVSGLGGDPHEVRCPWCEGSGRFIADHDAQAAREVGEGPAGG